MAFEQENFLLVQMIGDGTAIMQPIRTYLSSKRAEQDKELLEKINPTGTYLVLTIEHIDE